MESITLTGTDITTGKIALGTATFGLNIDENECGKIMNEYLENGGSIIDTALVYTDWAPGERSRSEKIIGRWIKSYSTRNSVIISTKGGHPNLNAFDVPRLGEHDIISDLEKSLKNLMTDYIDIYFLHRDDVNKDVGEIMETLNKIVLSGKARYVGLSNWKPSRIAQAAAYCRKHKISMPVASQIQFGIAQPNSDMIDPTTEYMTKEAYDFYKKEKMTVFSFSSQSGGYFFNLNENGQPNNMTYDNPLSRKKLKMLNEMTKKYNCSKAALIIAALGANSDFVTIPIIGPSNTNQLRASMDGLRLKPENKDVAELLKRHILYKTH